MKGTVADKYLGNVCLSGFTRNLQLVYVLHLHMVTMFEQPVMMANMA